MSIHRVTSEQRDDDAATSHDDYVLLVLTLKSTLKPTITPTIKPIIKPTIQPTIQPTIKSTVIDVYADAEWSAFDVTRDASDCL